MVKKQNRTLQDLGDLVIDNGANQEHSKDELETEIRQLRQQLANADENTELLDRIAELEEELQTMETSIIRVDDRRWQFHRFVLTATQLVPPEDLTSDEVRELGMALSSMGGAINFWLGDWANLILDNAESLKQDEFGEDAILSEEERHQIYENLVQDFSLDSVKSLRQYSSVCRIIPPSIRIDGVHYSNHQLVAFLPKELKGREQEFLQRAFDENMSKRTLADEIKKERVKSLPEKQELLYDPKPVLKKVKRLTKLFLLSDDARITDTDKKSYRKDLEDLKRLVSQLEDKLS